jgi:hypothetical protein
MRVASTQNTKTIFAGPKGADFLSSKIQAGRNLLPEPVEKRRLQDQINRGRRRAF